MRNWIGLVLVVVVFAAGCSAKYPASPTPTPTLAAVQLLYQGPHESVAPGSLVGLTLWAIDSEGAYEFVTTRASWFSSNTAVATVTNGTARAVASGEADIGATYQGLTATARINVRATQPYPYLRMTLSIPEVGRTTRVNLRYFPSPTADSRDVSTEATVTSSNPAVLTVEGSDLTGHAPGTAILTATFNGVQSSAYGSVPPMRTLP